MGKYGIPYQGSKNAIAEDVVRLLPPAEYFVDLFGGGLCNNTLRHAFRQMGEVYCK